LIKFALEDYDMLLSVIIPTHNRSNLLSDLLDSLFVLETRHFAWEILVVDNASTDDTRQVMQMKIPQAPVPLRYLYEPIPGLHQCRHRGTREARGKVVGFLDDDTIVTPQWISGIDLILSKQADAVASRILPKWEVLPPKWLTDLVNGGTLDLLTLLDQGEEPTPIDPIFVWGASFFIRRSLVFELGGFHPDGFPPELIRYRGDGETGFFREFGQQGYTAWYDPRSVAYHTVSQNRMTLVYLCQRSYNQGISDSYYQIRNPQAMNTGQISYLDGKSTKSVAYYIQRAREMPPSDRLRWLQNRVREFRRRLYPTRQEKIRDQLQIAYHAGWKFHQNAVQADPELLAFVLKKNYME
jgi:glycosyltransferase involved in cell wall biosynthesis